MNEFPIDHVILLNSHADRLMSSLYSSYFLFCESKVSFINNEIEAALRAINEGKSVYDPKFPSISTSTLQEMGAILRNPYLSLIHYKDFQQQALKCLLDSQNLSNSFNLSWNYMFVLPILQLFVKYIKLTILLSQIPDVDKIPSVYVLCLQKTNNREIESGAFLSSYLKERCTIRFLEGEFQPLFSRFSSLFMGIFPFINSVLKGDQNVDWTMFSISTNPEISNPKSTLFKQEYTLSTHLDLIIDSLICFYFVNSSSIASTPQFLDNFVLILANKGHLELEGGLYIEIRKLFETLQKSKLKKDDFRYEIFDTGATQMNIVSANRRIRQLRISSLLNEFLNAGKSDINTINMKMPVIFAVLGIANFEITSSLNKSNWGSIDNSFSYLVYKAISMVFLLFNSAKKIKRFMLYNIREYDSPYLEILLHSFKLPKDLYEKLSVIVYATKLADVAKFDEGVNFDLSPMPLAIARVLSGFNNYSTNHGIIHLEPLFGIMTSLQFRCNTFISPQYHALSIIPLHKYWFYIPALTRIIEASDQCIDIYSCSFLGLYHFFTYDFASQCENSTFRTTINGSFSSMIHQAAVLISKSVKSQYNNVGSNASYKNTLIYAEGITVLFEFGAITLFDQSFDLINQVIEKMINIIPYILQEEPVEPPNVLLKKLRELKKFTQYAITPTGHNPHSIIQQNLSEIRAVTLQSDHGVLTVTGTPGTLPSKYCAFYKQYCFEKLAQCYYSNTIRTFISIEKDTGHSPSYYISHNAFSALIDLLGFGGIVALDSKLVDVIDELFTRFAVVVTTLWPDRSQSPPWDNPSLTFNSSSEFIIALSHIGAVIKTRQILREAITSKGAIDPSYKFLTTTSTPEHDLVLMAKLRVNKALCLFESPSFPALFAHLFASNYWSNVSYDMNHNSFKDDCHLMGHSIDAMIAAIKVNNSQFNHIDHFKSMIMNAAIGIQNGIVSKKSFPRLMMFIVLDHFVKSSFYADYSMLEIYIPYQVIRSVYTSAFQGESIQ